MINIHTSSPVASSSSPVDHLFACHRRIEERLDTLERVGPRLLDRTDQALAALEAVFWFFDSSGIIHTADEEESFFPRVAASLTPAEQELVDTLQTQHQQAEALYDELKSHVHNVGKSPTPADQQRYIDLAGRLCALYRDHIRNEDAHFPVIAARALSPADLAAIDREMKSRRGQ
jgi:hemerythrin-like domain-containing protein